jgi:hypothetical protein
MIVVIEENVAPSQGVTERCRLSWLTNSALVCAPMRGEGGPVAGSQPMSTAVHRSPKINFGYLTLYLTYVPSTPHLFMTTSPLLPWVFTAACLPYLGQYMRARAVVNPPDKENVITPKINTE